MQTPPGPVRPRRIPCCLFASRLIPEGDELVRVLPCASRYDEQPTTRSDHWVRVDRPFLVRTRDRHSDVRPPNLPAGRQVDSVEVAQSRADVDIAVRHDRVRTEIAITLEPP